MKTLTDMMRVQRGSTTVNNSTVDVVINEVNPDFAIVNITGYNTANPVRVVLTNATTLSAWSSASCTINWEVRG